MRRKLFTLCSTVSLLLCVVVCVLWMRTYYVEESLDWPEADRRAVTQLSRGYAILDLSVSDWSATPARLTYGREAPNPAEVENARLRNLVLNVGPRDSFTRWTKLGVTWSCWRSAPPAANIIATAVVPLRLVAAGSAITPAAWCVVAWRRRLMRSNGLCPACGYDLRATPGRCPECGVEAAGR